MFSLPTVLCGHKISQNGDYRVVINAMCALCDEAIISDGPFGDERIYAAMAVFYEDFESIVDFDGAYREMCSFINGSSEERVGGTRLFDWEKDRLMIAGAVSATCGFPVMEREYLHWWSFLSYFNQIGDGAFATCIGIRSKLAKGKRLEKWERDALNQNPDIRLSPKLCESEQAELESLFDE